MNYLNPLKEEIDNIGGTEFIKSVLVSFYDKMFSDVMVSFLFSGTDKEHIIETQHHFLEKAFGYTKNYTGKPPSSAHTHLPILPGHFDRRIQLLKETLESHNAPESLIAKWIKLENSFRQKILENSKNAKGK